MARTSTQPKGASWATRVFAITAAAVTVLGAALAVLLVLDAQRNTRVDADRVTQSVAVTLAAMPEVAAALMTADLADELQPIATEVMDKSGVDFVTIMTTDGIRVTHRDPEQIGAHYLGTIPESPQTLTEEFTGTLGTSVRTIVPITEPNGQLVGWVSVGVTLGSIASNLAPRLPFAIAIAIAVLAAGLAAALLARRTTRRVAGDLPIGAVRDTLASYESVRTIGEALRAQTHEHGNRMHTAVALIELGRTDEAVALLTESSAQSQRLVDQVAARSNGDATLGALLIGKSAQVAERGIQWQADIAPNAPRSVLSPVDQVALVGNLIDNAADAAAAGDAPRWIRVQLERTSEGELLIAVSDSGEGVPPSAADQIFERGFSTKPAGSAGRGVGLALVRAIVDDAGGTVTLTSGLPTTFRVILPQSESFQ